MDKELNNFLFEVKRILELYGDKHTEKRMGNACHCDACTAYGDLDWKYFPEKKKE